MKLIVDGGSTKTAWAFCMPGVEPLIVCGEGLNGMTATAADIAREASRALHEAGVAPEEIDTVDYFGAGCATDASCLNVASGLARVIPVTARVGSDLLCAANALFPDKDGIACILGTGSNSGLWLNGEIVSNISPLGFILGDEGSGAALGKRLAADALRGMIAPELREELAADYGLSKEAALEAVYRKPGGNVWLAALVPFLKKHIGHPDINHILIEEFSAFIVRNIDEYPDSRSYPLGFVGSVAYYFADILRSVAASMGYVVTDILRDPIDALARRACS